MSESLKNLQTIPKLPKRYEDTKPALNQVFTHKTILDIGEKISAETIKQQEDDKQVSLRRCEEEGWEKAKLYKDQCVKEALANANSRTEKEIRKLQKQHEQTLKKETSRVEDIMQHICVEKVNEERIAGEKKLNEIISKLYASFAIEKALSVEQARNEEQNIAEEQRKDLLKKCQQEMKEQRTVDQERELLKKEELRSQMEEEKRQAVEETIIREQQSAKDYLMKVEKHHRDIISDLVRQLEKERAEKRATIEELKRMTALKDMYVCKLKKAKQEMIGFVESSRPDFYKGQSDYIFSSSLFEFEVGDQ